MNKFLPIAEFRYLLIQTHHNLSVLIFPLFDVLNCLNNGTKISLFFPFPEAIIQVSGAKTGYFPMDQDCLTTMSSTQLQEGIFADLKTELKDQGVEGQVQHPCLMCGRV